MLTTPSNLGLGQTQEQQEHEAWDSYDDIFMALSCMGFDPPGKPPFPIPTVNPQSYVNLEGDHSAILAAQVDAWYSYTSSTLAEVKGRLDAIRNEMDAIGVDLRKQIRLEVEGHKRDKKPPESEMKDLLKELPHYRGLMKLEQDYYIMQRHINAILDGLDRHAKGLSRQVTVRGQNIELGHISGRRPPNRRISE